MIEKTCQHCGKSFQAYRSQEKKFCSYECAHASMRKPEGEKRAGIGVEVEVLCAVCGTTFQTRRRRPARYCSKKCFGAAQTVAQTATCEWCGKEFRPGANTEGRFCSRSCMYESRRVPVGEFSVGAGRASISGKIVQNSYKTVAVGGKTRMEHRVIMERVMGRPLLASEVVHHKDGDHLNNDPSNLVVVTRSEHTRQHRQVPEGKWSLKWNQCQSCGTTETPYGGQGLCQSCYNREYSRFRRSTVRD